MTTLTGVELVLSQSQDRENPSAQAMADLLERVETIAVVGMSTNPQKPARKIPAYLKSKGYEIIPVNPTTDEILGIPARKSLTDVTEPVDMVLVFRPSADAALVLAEAARRAEGPVIWLQEGILAPKEAAQARADGLTVVQDLCIYKVHSALPQGD